MLEMYVLKERSRPSTQSLATRAEDFWEDRFLSFVQDSELSMCKVPPLSEDGSKTPV